jgi:CheY-like chemotaxis protein
MSPLSPTYLLIDDNKDDATLTREALMEAAPEVHLTWAPDGLEAMALLRGGLRPDLVLLDLNMPRMDGRETLQQIKGDPELSSLPVVILTTSDAERDIVESYRGRANAYLVKPVIIDDLISVLRQLSDFWLSDFLRLPPKGD